MNITLKNVKSMYFKPYSDKDFLRFSQNLLIFGTLKIGFSSYDFSQTPVADSARSTLQLSRSYATLVSHI